ncbi:glycogen synthase, partial [bacterium]|nr:glycogen synthase [bacterium]
YFIKHKIFDGPNVYLGRGNYVKNVRRASKKKRIKGVGDVERFTFFSKAVVEMVKEFKWRPDVIHCHDWHTALLPTFVDEYNLEDTHFDNIRTLFTIHNLANQGVTGLDIVDYGSMDHRLTPALMEDYYDKDGHKIDSMKVGILSADYINTVSPNYAKEILTKEYGAGLEKYLLRRKNHLAGIVNGLDLKLFDPAKDKLIKKRYTLKTIVQGKQSNKEYLQKTSKLPVEDKPVFGLVTRLVKQKGLDILLPALESIVKKHDIQVVILGTGYDKYEDGFKELAKKYPEKVRADITFSLKLAQQIYAGSDFFLMPSRFEPCGLGQMIAMRYGTIPIVRQTGGLKDTVNNNKTGVVFKKYTQIEMRKALERSIRIYNNKTKFKKIRAAGMREDFSWNRSAKDYIKLYKKLK